MSTKLQSCQGFLHFEQARANMLIERQNGRSHLPKRSPEPSFGDPKQAKSLFGALERPIGTLFRSIEHVRASEVDLASQIGPPRINSAQRPELIVEADQCTSGGGQTVSAHRCARRNQQATALASKQARKQASKHASKQALAAC